MLGTFNILTDGDFFFFFGNQKLKQLNYLANIRRKNIKKNDNATMETICGRARAIEQ